MLTTYFLLIDIHFRRKMSANPSQKRVPRRSARLFDHIYEGHSIEQRSVSTFYLYIQILYELNLHLP